MPSASPEIVVCRATAEDLPRIENLMQFYNYDLSEWVPVEFGPSGLYALRPKQAYWAQASVVPYKVLVDGRWAGFAVVDDEVADPASQHNLGYFFVARRYRGLGVGLQAAKSVFQAHPGRWEVYHLERNQAARLFWEKALLEIAAESPVVHTRMIDGFPSTLYAFSINEP